MRVYVTMSFPRSLHYQRPRIFVHPESPEDTSVSFFPTPPPQLCPGPKNTVSPIFGYSTGSIRFLGFVSKNGKKK